MYSQEPKWKLANKDHKGFEKGMSGKEFFRMQTQFTETILSQTTIILTVTWVKYFLSSFTITQGLDIQEGLELLFHLKVTI
jgi:hypothetical protein